jgi:diguanylate cyclase (GGDEF)-like protein
MNTQNSAHSLELVPLAERLRYLRFFRFATAAALLAVWGLLPELRDVGLATVLIVTLAYLLLSVAAEAAWRRSHKRGLVLWSGLLILDALYLAGMAYALGGLESPVRYLVFVHLIAVALLSSFRTGLKLALWHSVLLYGTFYAQEAGVLGTFGREQPVLGDAEFRLMLVWIVAFWAVAFATAAFAAINERELRRRRYDLEALARLALELEKSTDDEYVARTLANAVADDFGFERVLLFVRPADELVLLHQRGGKASHVPTAPGARSVLMESMTRHRTVLVDEVDSDDDTWLDDLLPGARNLVVVPLHAEARPVGVLVAEHAMRKGSRAERRVVSMLERFASQSALALNNAWLLMQIERAASTDGLTGLANRTSFDQALERELGRAQRTGGTVSLVMLDLDHFKGLNDLHGHLEGDAALKQVSAVLAQMCRFSDIVARYGGEEFAVLMPDTTEEVAAVGAERLREAIAALPGPAPLRASFGVASYPGSANEAVSLLRAADAALYASKRAGRDRVTCASAVAEMVVESIPPPPLA